VDSGTRIEYISPELASSLSWWSSCGKEWTKRYGCDASFATLLSSWTTQIFVEPEIRRLAFDQKDLHPNDVFTKVEATFIDGTTAKTDKEES
jgi:hypothetical protein